jgi:hypothetical protein
LEEHKEKIIRKLRSEMEGEEEIKERDGFNEDDSSVEMTQKETIESKAEKKIGCCRRFWYRFRVPRILQIITLFFLITYWFNLLLKLIFESVYNGIELSDTEFLHLDGIEIFQFIIFTIDYILALLIASVMIAYIYTWFEPMHFIMSYMNKFILHYFPFLTILITMSCIIGALLIMYIFGLHMFETYNFLFSFLTCWLMLSRGPLYYQHVHKYLKEDYQYVNERVHIFLLIIMILLIHFYTRYFVINLSVSAFLDQFSITRKEIEQQKRKRRIAKERKRQQEMEENGEEEKKE